MNFQYFVTVNFIVCKSRHYFTRLIILSTLNLIKSILQSLFTIAWDLISMMQCYVVLSISVKREMHTTCSLSALLFACIGGIIAGYYTSFSSCSNSSEVIEIYPLVFFSRSKFSSNSVSVARENLSIHIITMVVNPLKMYMNISSLCNKFFMTASLYEKC